MCNNINNESPLKKALVLFGSPRNNGFTKKLLCEFTSRLKGYDVTIIDSYKENIKPCVACGNCERSNGCIYNDFDYIDSMLKTVDLLIIATPVYNLSFPAPLKSILDRTQRYFSARFCRGIKPPIEKKKKAVLLLTSGSKGELGHEIIKKQLKMIFTILNATLEHEIIWENTDLDDINNIPLKKIEEAVELLILT